MTNERFLRVKSIFLKILDLPEERWEECLDETCAEDTALRVELDGLIANYYNSTQFLESPVVDPPDQHALDAEKGRIGSYINAYRIVRKIGSGGMGTVYEAFQESPKRRVALKTLRTGLTAPQAIRFFEQEVQILARLLHPGIAQIYHAGTEEDGEYAISWFAMEYIPNAQSIADFAHRKKLDLRSRLELFIKVCEAVHYGHQKGIIHRDLKPANILIDSSSDDVLPKVIDFGIARTTDSASPSKSLTENQGQIIGTLHYMSPEQCSGECDKLDIRSDIYSLGVILYELIGRRLPYDLSNKTIIEAISIIKEKGPHPLSLIDQRLPSDIETITLKALAKDPVHRYSSAFELARDIQSFLNHKPIEARPQSALYQLRLFALRNKLLVWSFILFLGLLLSAAIVSTHFAIVASHNATGAFNHAQEADRMKKRAIKRAEEAERTLDFLEYVLILSDARATGRFVSVQELLKRASLGIDAKLDGQPTVESKARGIIGRSFKALGNFDEAQKHLEIGLKIAEDSLAPLNPIAWENLKTLADVYLEKGDYELAESLYQKALELSLKIYGNEHVNVFITIHSMALLYREKGDLEKAQTLCSTAWNGFRRLEIDNDYPVLAAMNMANILADRGSFDDAEEFLLNALNHEISTRGIDHTRIYDIYNNLAILHGNRGNLQKAENFLRKSLNGYYRLMGPEHPETVHIKMNLAILLLNRGEDSKAEKLLIEALNCFSLIYGKDHPRIFNIQNSLGLLYSDRGEFNKSIRFLRDSLDGYQKILGLNHQETFRVTVNLAALLANTQEIPESELLLKDVLARCQELEIENPVRFDAMIGLAGVFCLQNKVIEAESLYREALSGFRRIYGDDNIAVYDTLNNLATPLTQRGEYTEAEACLKKALEGYKLLLGEDHWRTIHIMQNLARLLNLMERWDEAIYLMNNAITKTPHNQPQYAEYEKLLETIIENKKTCQSNSN